MFKLIRDKKVFMNTSVEFTAWTKLSRSHTYKVFDKGFDHFSAVIRKFSRFDNNSDLMKFNNSNQTKRKVSQELFSLIEKALDIADNTKGIFDPTIIDFLETYGYKNKMNFSPLEKRTLLEKEIAEISEKRTSYKEIKLDRKKLTITMAKRQRIDLGGIGKGYAIDLACKELAPLENFIINAGGDLKARGKDKTNKPWLVELKVPGENILGKINLKDSALCCSGAFARKVKYFHHLINPKNGKPKNDLKAVFVKADKAIDADAWSTALFVAGKEAPELIENNNLKAVLVYSDNKIGSYNFSL